MEDVGKRKTKQGLRPAHVFPFIRACTREESLRSPRRNFNQNWEIEETYFSPCQPLAAATDAFATGGR